MLNKEQLEKYIRFCLILALLSCDYACAVYPYEKELFAWQMPKSQVSALKNILLSEGYRRRSGDDFPYEGAFVTQYVRELSIANKKNEIIITMSFKKTGDAAENYRNIGIDVSSTGCTASPAVKDEIIRMEEIIYRALIELTGEHNVIRGER